MHVTDCLLVHFVSVCVCVCIRCLFEHHWYSASRCLFETTLLNTVCNCTSECVFFYVCVFVDEFELVPGCTMPLCTTHSHSIQMLSQLHHAPIHAQVCVCVCVVSNSSSGIQLILSLYFKFFSELYSGISHLIII